MELQKTSPLKRVVDAVRAMVSGASPVRPILLVGRIGAGKTAAGLRLAALLRQAGIPSGGILAPRVLRGEETVGYTLLDLATGTAYPFAGIEPSDVAVGRFFVSNGELERAGRAIRSGAKERAVVFVDEVGRLELGGGGHATALRELLCSSSVPILLVRDAFVDDVVRAFDLEDPIRYDVADAGDSILAGPAETEVLWRIVDSIPFPLLVTRGEGGFPASRPMTLVHRDERTLWFVTSRASRKVAHVETDPRVTVLFVDSDRFSYASLQGRAQLVDDPEREAAFWRDDWRDDWPDGPSDPDFVLLRVDGIRGQYHHGATEESGSLDLLPVA